MNGDSEIDQINKYVRLYSKYIVNLSLSLGLLVRFGFRIATVYIIFNQSTKS